MKNITLSLIIPCYNEEAVILKSGQVLASKLKTLVKAGTISAGSRILFVDDGRCELGHI